MMEEKTMEQVLKENWEKTRLMKIERNKRAKQERRKETILAIVIGLFIIAGTIMLLKNTSDRFMEDCTSAGHSTTYCERGM